MWINIIKGPLELQKKLPSFKWSNIKIDKEQGCLERVVSEQLWFPSYEKKGAKFAYFDNTAKSKAKSPTTVNTEYI